MNILTMPLRVFHFYRDGFRRMTLGRSLWKIIIIKLVIMFAILKVFVFPNFLKHNFSTDEARAEHILQELTLKQTVIEKIE